MKPWRSVLFLVLIVAVIATACIILLIRRGFSARLEPSSVEKVLARTVRNLAIPNDNRNQKNPWTATPDNLQEARDHFIARCAVCHGSDGKGQTQMGQSLYPRVP